MGNRWLLPCSIIGCLASISESTINGFLYGFDFLFPCQLMRWRAQRCGVLSDLCDPTRASKVLKKPPKIGHQPHRFPMISRTIAQQNPSNTTRHNKGKSPTMFRLNYYGTQSAIYHENTFERSNIYFNLVFKNIDRILKQGSEVVLPLEGLSEGSASYINVER